MAALLKKIRNRGKHEETPSSTTAAEETVVSEETSTEPPVSMSGILMQLYNFVSGGERLSKSRRVTES